MKLKKIVEKKDTRVKTNLMMFLLFCVLTLSLSVGYAALNQELNISGEASFRVEEEIRITNVELSETTNLGLENYTSKYGKDSITLGVVLPNIESTVTYKVEIINSGTVSMWIDSIAEEIKNNANMEYVLEGLGIKELINPGETKEFNLTIKYKDVIILPNNINLDTMLRFNFVKPTSILASGSFNATQDQTFYNGTILKSKVEKITFEPTLEVGENAIGYWDASYNKDGTVIAWYTDVDNNDLYELNIGGIGEVYAPSDSGGLFSRFNNVTSINFEGYFNTSNVTNMTLMFRGNTKLTVLDLSGFNTSKVSSMNQLFSQCASLKEIDLSSFDTSKVTNMGAMFNTCSKLTLLDLSSFNTSNVNSMLNMFYGCSKLVSLDVSGFNTSKVKSMESMFRNCSKLESLDLSNFNTSNVIDMKLMFQECNSLTNLDISNFNTINVTNMSSMFKGCVNLKELDVSSFNTQNVLSMEGMFAGCQSITFLSVINFNTEKVTNMHIMFDGCKGLKNLNLSSFDTSKVKYFGSMFDNCTLLNSLDIRNFTFTSATDESNSMTFNNMFRLVPVNAEIYVKNDHIKNFVLEIRNDLTNIIITEN